MLFNKGRQWYTRVLYNSHLPFNYSFILDTHVFPCFNTSYQYLFEQFKHSNVDISISNRTNIQNVSGGAVLSKRGEGSHYFWNECVKYMIDNNNYEDQSAISYVLRTIRTGYSFKLLSSNWFYASHGINENGIFSGNSKCYRSSIVVTGPIHWIHGSPSECAFLNGKSNEHINKYRATCLCGKCDCGIKGPILAFSEEELQNYAFPNMIPKLKWKRDNKRDPYSIFWAN